ncbi:DUF1156 domain-containing protein [Crocosphaera sp. UHCC 0190]|uniref:DUF1156 domain-containing protein n=1 Tax=Crocosphaera sp. UHCC 0190 TaxID=3110246 RepID=UPI002B21FACE|nr:DUF1156 domain-containing protein [Crocosphaera sp. UHCC 0190]MEA5512319.1 DUF1156 domain-containing protein [Crocosphaera sp. UHCC 0190]
MNNDRRLIEDFIPIKEISKESAREKSIRKGHISTLHLWWARRPLVAARAAVFASLIPAPETPQKRTALAKTMIELCKWEASEETIKKARNAILEAQRTRLGLPENTPLKEVPAPKIADLFAGGGAIPLEGLRLGCETYAIELNPVAHIIELCTLVYPQKYGKKLADEVEKWGHWVIEKVKGEIGDLYPEIVVGEGIQNDEEQLDLFQPKTKQLGLNFTQKLRPVAYLWTRTVKCPNPSCGASVPLVRQTWLCKKSKKYVALKVIPNHQTKRVDFEVIETTTAKDLGFDPASGSSRGSSTCHHCGTTFKNDHVKTEGKAGRIGQQLMAIVCTTAGKQGKTYLSATDYQRYIPDESAILQRLENLCQETGLTIPDEPIFSGDTRAFFTHLYGLDNFGKLFTPRQLLSLMTFVKWVRLAHEEILQDLGVGSWELGVKGEDSLNIEDLGIERSFGAVAEELGKDQLKMGDLGKDKNEESNVKGLGENTSQNSENYSSSNVDVKLPKKSLNPKSQFLIPNSEEERKEFAKAICTYLALATTKTANRGSNLGVYHSGRETIESPISSGRLPMCWDFPETNPIGTGSGNWLDGLDWMIQALKNLVNIENIATAFRQPCQKLNLADSSLDAVITDPPYFDAVPYSDLSDYFYVHLKRAIGHLYPEHFSGQLTPKKKEAIMEASRYGGDKQKAAKAYEDMMHQAFCEANRILKNNGIIVVVYAHKTTAGWTTLIDSLRRAKFTITEAFPIDTEQPGGLRGLKASLASSIFLIARKRTTSEVGDYAMDVQPLLKEIIQERVKTLMENEVSGADLVIACVGAGLRAYTQYDRVIALDFV